MSCWKVSKKHLGKPLRKFLRDNTPEQYSVRQLKWAVDQGLVEVNGHVEQLSTKTLNVGDTICINYEGLVAKDNIKKKFEPERVLFEDDYLLAYDKPPMITSTDQGGLFSILKRRHPGLKALHRLDRDTSGVILFAKKDVAAEGILKQFKEREIKKVYWAIVDGIPIRDSGDISNYLGRRVTLRGQVKWGIVDPEYGLASKTSWRALKKGGGIALIECSPKTGRTHQIRVHLSHIGHPILGDFRYGCNFQGRYKPYRLLLHAYKLEFVHPLSGDLIRLAAPLPDDFRQAIKYIDNCS
ncbi:MAG: RluA family pseudouridine synthase [Chlamydiota bacterium]